jgi:hypothetical protein
MIDHNHKFRAGEEVVVRMGNDPDYRCIVLRIVNGLVSVRNEDGGWYRFKGPRRMPNGSFRGYQPRLLTLEEVDEDRLENQVRDLCYEIHQACVSVHTDRLQSIVRTLERAKAIADGRVEP